MPSSSRTAPLQIRMLGELQVLRAGARLDLPPSKKTRALLGYLLLTARPQRRERLCELFWDVADDPRAALRWSLSKLRELLDDEGRVRLLADREQVALDVSDVEIDALLVKSLLASGPELAAAAALDQAVPLFRGELLEGLELPEFPAYYAFCVAERSAFRELHRRALNAMLRDVQAEPAKALPLLRRLVELDPVDSQRRGQLFDLLKDAGRASEAEQRTRASQRLFADPSPAAEAGSVSQRGPAPTYAQPRKPAAQARFVGRARELALLRALLAERSHGARCALIQGDPGIGKSRLLSELLHGEQRPAARSVRIDVAEGRVGFPYAPFLELLQTLSAEGAEETGVALSSPRTAGTELEVGREQLFRRVTERIAAAVADSPLVLVIEDAHWLDEGSLSLLQFVTSSLRQSPVTIILTARRGELHDQPAARRVLRSLKREGRLLEIALGPLSHAEIEQLVASASGDLPLAELLAQSAGHPLIALELSRHIGNLAEAMPRSLTELIRDRLAVLPSEPMELLNWASVLGVSFDSELVGRLLTCEPEQLVESLEYLERHGLLGFSASQDGAACRFSHAVVRRAVYDQLSEPRRRLMHARVARLLMQSGNLADDRASVVAHHAALGADNALAVRACLIAGRRCLRLFAPLEARTLARLGLKYALQLDDDASVVASLELLEVAVTAERPAPADLVELVVKQTNRALDLGATAHARLGFFLQSVLTWDLGRSHDAGRFTREAERLSRSAEPRERLLGLSEAARCLALLEQELPEAEAFLLEAEALAARAREPLPACAALARGTLLAYRGEYAAAENALENALERARSDGERLNEFGALELLVDVQLQQGAYGRARSLVVALTELGQRLQHGSELLVALAFAELSAYALEPHASPAALVAAIARLEPADAKQRSAVVANRAAEQLLQRGELVTARGYAARALELANAVALASEAHAARALLALIAERAGERDVAMTQLAALGAPVGISAHAHGLVTRALALAGAPLRSPKARKKGERRWSE